VTKRTGIHGRRAGARSLAGLMVAALAVATCVACSTESAPQPAGPVTKLPEPGDVIDQELMIALAQAKNYHHKAKVYMSDGNLADATAAVRQILSLRFPAGAPEAEDVRLDARALLAKLLVSAGQLDEAMRMVSEGLAGASRESFFVANLHTVAGEIHEARAAQLDAAGEPARAADEKRAAIAAYDRSIRINEALQQRLMEGR
jgi:tetratricopeptide (TPR) repeat protein